MFQHQSGVRVRPAAPYHAVGLPFDDVEALHPIPEALALMVERWPLWG